VRASERKQRSDEQSYEDLDGAYGQQMIQGSEAKR